MMTPEWNRFRNGETVQFFQHFIRITNTYDLEALSLEKERAALVNQFSDLEHIFNASTASTRTRKLTELDTERGNALKGIHRVAEANTYHFNKNRVEASEKINAIFRKYGTTIDRLPYAHETATIRNLYRDLKANAEYDQYLNLLGLSNWLEHLNQTNEEFETVFLERNKENAQNSSLNFATIRKSMIDDYRVLVEVLKARHLLDTTGAYETLVAELNALIEKSNNSARARQNRLSNELEQENSA